jgi:putative endonuclease
MVPGVAGSEAGPDDAMHYVYMLRSEFAPEQTYIGYSTDLKARLLTHNAGGSLHTRKFPPWRLVTYFAFSDKQRALAFERYLKSHSGQAFAAKRLWSGD